jgi:mannosyl-glycoprotein endo-beta-N-acetylglucosaminidase
MLVTGVSAASIGGGTTTTAVNFRTGASTSHSIITTLPAGTNVVITDSSGGWYRAVYNGTEGYLSGDYVRFTTALGGSFGTGTVNGTSVNVRSGAGLDAAVIGAVNTGNTLTVTGVNGKWYQVSVNGATGYVCSDYLQLSGGSAPSGGSSTGTSDGTKGTVKGDEVRLRSGPGTGYGILGAYNHGTALTILGTENGWTKVNVGGLNGFIRSDYVASGSSSAPSGSQTTQAGYINGTSVRLRSGANTSSQILGVYDTGTEMTITGSNGNWYAVSYNGMNGYVCKDYMVTTKPGSSAPAPTTTEGYVKGNSVRLRSGPGTGYSILGGYNNGTPLTITGTSGDWTAVTINGLKGYMSSVYVTTTKPAAPSANPSVASSDTPTTNPTGQLVVETAKKYLGYPYVYGGMSPSGFDCSGFVGYVYKQCGYSLKRVASDIYYNNGTSVSKANLQPGDLVFFSNSSSSLGHVGLYIGGNQFIHASTSTVGVIISDLTSTYYINHYVGAKRIIQ